MNFFRKTFRLYYDGFRSMTVGRTLWVIILVKLFIMFAVFRLFFFHDLLGSRFSSEKEKADYVSDQLINKSN
jgi:hypothetical protein